LDGVEEIKGVVMLGATNRLNRLDPAILRPGRFDEVVEIPLSDELERWEIFEVHLRGKPMARNIKVSALAAKTKDFSGAHIASVCNLAALRAVRRAVVVLKDLSAKPAKAGAEETDDSGASKSVLEVKAKMLLEAEDLEDAVTEVAAYR